MSKAIINPLYQDKPWKATQGTLGNTEDVGMGNNSTYEINLGGRTIKNPKASGSLVCGTSQGWSQYQMVLQGIRKGFSTWEDVAIYGYTSNPTYGMVNSLTITVDNKVAYTKLRWNQRGQYGCTMRNCIITEWLEQ